LERCGVANTVTNNLDIGLELEQAINTVAWARYSILNNPNGFSFATTGGVFLSRGQIQSNGYYLGALASRKINEEYSGSLGYRHTILDYVYGDAVEPGTLFTNIRFENPTDGSVNGQTDLLVAKKISENNDAIYGLSCQYLYKNRDLNNRSGRCLPIVGVSHRF